VLTRITLVLILFVARSALAIEVASDLSVSRDFVYLTTDVAHGFVDESATLGVGFGMIGDYRTTRFGARVLAEHRAELWTAGVAAAWAPPQEHRGWITLSPHASAHRAWTRVALEAGATLNLRRVDVGLARGPVSIDQIQIEGELGATLDETWSLSVRGLISSYDEDLRRRTFRRGDLGLLITTAGRPEQWALAGRLARRSPHWRIEGGVGGVVFADDTGSAVLPRAALGIGPWGGFSVETSIEMVVGIGRRAELAMIGGLSLGFER
jgi:hypothetical protein